MTLEHNDFETGPQMVPARADGFDRALFTRPGVALPGADSFHLLRLLIRDRDAPTCRRFVDDRL